MTKKTNEIDYKINNISSSESSKEISSSESSKEISSSESSIEISSNNAQNLFTLNETSKEISSSDAQNLFTLNETPKDISSNNAQNLFTLNETSKEISSSDVQNLFTLNETSKDISSNNAQNLFTLNETSKDISSSDAQNLFTLNETPKDISAVSNHKSDNYVRDIIESDTIDIYIPGAGLGFMYLIGCMLYLTKKKKIRHYSGVSAGGIVAAIFALGLDPYDFIAYTWSIREEYVAAKLGMWFNLESSLRKIFENYFPNHIDYTKINNLAIRLSEFNYSRTTYFVDKFCSKDDLINCIIASCYIPLFLSIKPFSVYKGKWYIDGAGIKHPHYEKKINDEILNNVSNEMSGEKSNETLNNVSDETSNKMLDETSNETSGETPNETSNEMSDEISNEASAETSNNVSDETSNEASDEISNEASAETSNEASAETSNNVSDETSNEASDETSNDASAETSNKTLGETPNETQSETSNETSDKALDETSDKASDEILNDAISETPKEVSNEAPNEVSDKTLNEPFIDTLNGTSLNNKSFRIRIFEVPGFIERSEMFTMMGAKEMIKLLKRGINDCDFTFRSLHTSLNSPESDYHFVYELNNQTLVTPDLPKNNTKINLSNCTKKIVSQCESFIENSSSDNINDSFIKEVTIDAFNDSTYDDFFGEESMDDGETLVSIITENIPESIMKITRDDLDHALYIDYGKIDKVLDGFFCVENK
jgi:hypothetical protein